MTIDANALEKMAKERPDECFLKGSGVLKLLGAIRQLKREARRAAEVQALQAVPNGWRCFHCDGAFTDAEQAALHFGTRQYHEPACQVSAERLRELESELERYREEDTGLHRQIYGMQAEHTAALRREEEKGYARGLADAATLSTPSEPDRWKRALHAAVAALYFDDSSDFKSALGTVVRHLDEWLASELLCTPKAAYDKACAMVAAPVHDSDCSTHNEPAYPAGSSDCSARANQ